MLPSFVEPAEIVRTPVASSLPEATVQGALWQAGTRSFLLEVPGIARYLVSDGKRIAIESAPGADETQVEYFLRKTPLAAMLYQRGMLVFHAAAAATPQGAVLIAGDSACGKSTILAALLAAGWALLADDLAPVRIDDDGQAYSVPTSGEVVLWQRSLDILGAVSPEPWRLRPTWRPNRQVADFRDRLAGTLVPLRAAICLKPRSDGTHKVDVIQGWRRLAWLGGITYNYRVLEALAPPLAYFRCAAALGRAVECKTLHYPLGERGLEMLSAKLIGALTGLDARK